MVTLINVLIGPSKPSKVKLVSFQPRQLAGQELAPIGLGCMPLSQAYFPLPDEADAMRLVHSAIDLGCTHLDTARLYGRGHNEELLSRVLNARRDEVFLATKCGIEVADGKRWIDCSPENIRVSLEKSLSVLGVDHVDLFYLHRRDFEVPIEDSVGELATLKDEGKIGAIGLSEMSAETLRAAAAVHPIAALQSEYSLWTRNPELGALETCMELGTAFVAFSPVARGALANAVPAETSALAHGDLRTKHPRFNSQNWPKNRRLIEQFNSLAGEAGCTPAQLSLCWVLAQGDHVHAIPGTGNPAHLEENWASLLLDIDQSILDRASTLINQQTVSGHRYPESMRQTIDTEDFEPAL